MIDPELRNRQHDRYDLVDGRPPSVIAILSASDSQNAPPIVPLSSGAKAHRRRVLVRLTYSEPADVADLL